MKKKKKVEILIHGIVQGVGFRPFIYRLADDISISGTVQNLGDAGVEVILEGSQEKIEEFLNRLSKENPPLSYIQSIDICYNSPTELKGFQILKSDVKGSGSGTIPPDTAMCDNCYEDMRDNNSRYHEYWATSCVDCGPRFTVIEGLPYDRPRTSMVDFPMCDSCRSEYNDPGSRRYHAQTIACPDCGPQVLSVPSTNAPIEYAGKALRDGKTIAIKGVGGTHIACNALDESAVHRLKQNLHRLHKPLPIMAKDLKMIKGLCTLNEKEKKALRSIRRPIVVLSQIEDTSLAPGTADGLHNIGVMLPYTGMHYLLFDHIDFPIVMTSANLAGRPMLIKNEDIISELEGIVDFTLLHDRNILVRCDDSVVRYSGGSRRFIRRSRGWAPSPISLDLGRRGMIALGAEFDNTIAFYKDKNCYISQHIGDINDIETLEYLKEIIDHFCNITNMAVPERVICDLHPGFMTTELAEQMNENPIKVQHHHAHIASLIGEMSKDEDEFKELIGIAADGAGYGPDGSIWGGEVLHVDRSGYKRLGSLSPMLMPGGDIASVYPARMIAGIFHDSSDLYEILSNYAQFGKGKTEQETVIKQTKNRFNTPITTSAGRYLDAVSSLLNICHERIYEGEPAMKLESIAVQGKPLNIEPPIEKFEGRPVLDIQSIFRELIELKEKKVHRKDIAATAQDLLARGLAEIAIRCAQDKGIDTIGFTGGTAYNDQIGLTVRDTVIESGLNYITNQKLPCGDGGISFGQLVVASKVSN